MTTAEATYFINRAQDAMSRAITDVDIEAAGKLRDLVDFLAAACDAGLRATHAADEGDRSRASLLRARCEAGFTSAREILKPGEEI